MRFEERPLPLPAFSHRRPPSETSCLTLCAHGDHVLEKLCHTILAIRFQWLPPLRAERLGLIGKKEYKKQNRGRKLFHLLLENSPFMLLPQGRNVGKWKTKVISHKMLLSFVFLLPPLLLIYLCDREPLFPLNEKINKWIKRKRKKGTKETSRR